VVNVVILKIFSSKIFWRKDVDILLKLRTCIEIYAEKIVTLGLKKIGNFIQEAGKIV
jgi:hypothetical protein